MLDPKIIETHPDKIAKLLKRRNIDENELNISMLLEAIASVRHLTQALQEHQTERKAMSKSIAQLLAKNDLELVQKQKEKVSQISAKMNQIKQDLAICEEKKYNLLLELPNWLADDVPDGGEADNIILEEWSEKTSFSFKAKTHYDIAEQLGLLDVARGVKLAGTRFYTYRGLLARLERALISFMLDVHTRKFNYTEVFVPLLIGDDSMRTTGQFPKFKNDYYHLQEDCLSLIPTAEVPLVNLYRDEIIDEKDLPLLLTAASSCFRREAGAAGKDTRGLVRVHQFQKVELVALSHPNQSATLHMQMLEHAKEILRSLNLPFRTILKAVGDTGISAIKSYDLEVWMPGLNRWLEISSVSNCEEFQSRRGNIRYKPQNQQEATARKNPFVHTLNGSGVAAGRCMIAIIENCQKEDGTFTIPSILEPYLNPANAAIPVSSTIL